MPLFPRFVPPSNQQANRAQNMNLETLLSLLGSEEANASSYHHQSPTHTSPRNASHNQGHPHARAFTPNFDIIETKDAYVLEGELPGLNDKRAVDIEFTDHQTLLIKGKIEKTTTTTTPAAPSGAKQITSGEEEHHEEHPRPKTPPRPTVEDDVDEDDGKSSISTPASTVVSHHEEKSQSQTQQNKEKIRYWVSERTIGSFQRTFSFPGLIDQDRVTAKLENGILTIVVPKRSKLPTKRIEIQ